MAPQLPLDLEALSCICERTATLYFIYGIMAICVVQDGFWKGGAAGHAEWAFDVNGCYRTTANGLGGHWRSRHDDPANPHTHGTLYLSVCRSSWSVGAHSRHISFLICWSVRAECAGAFYQAEVFERQRCVLPVLPSLVLNALFSIRVE